MSTILSAVGRIRTAWESTTKPDYFQLSPSNSSSSSTPNSPDSLSRFPSTTSSPFTLKRRPSHPVLWVIVGFVLSSVLATGILGEQTKGFRKELRVKEDAWRARERFAQTEGENVVRLGPRKSKLNAVGRKGVPGAKGLLTAEAPALSMYDALRKDLRYLTADSWSGEVGQLLSAFSLLHLAQQTQRIAIVPSIWKDGDHYGTSSVRMGDLFDLEKFRLQTGTLFVEWSDVKDYRSRQAKQDDIGCIFSWNGFHDGRSFGDYKLSSSAWSIERPYSFASNSIEGHILSDYDFPSRLSSLGQVANETGRALPRNLKDDQLMCWTNIWGLTRAGVSAPRTWWNTDYKYTEGVQATEGGMSKLLHPSMRGVHPEWWSVGQYLDFTPAVWEIALLAIERTLQLNPGEGVPNLITVHIRRGDFASWCNSGSGCVAPIESYQKAVEELKKELPGDTKVLVTTDETSPSFHSSLSSLGWFTINHSSPSVGTSSLLRERYGASSGWWDSAVDQAILSIGKGFVGTLDSQVSLVSALRVMSWNDGLTKFVTRPH
ncbi:O-fucosyltransferase family protein [Sporobolomyces salmoneus]|uniref:O-fucosyltransferase family protein n=1 Tax=Sporobolomyces salmoneus TaxID=183962 RepID=UPI003176373B